MRRLNFYIGLQYKVYDIKFNSEAPLILDCGSNIGLSIIYFKTHYPKAIIYGFEPDLRVFELLKENLSVFNFSDVSVYNSAVWSSEGFIEFNPEGSLAGSVVSRNRPDFESYKVKAISLRPYLEDSKIDFLKFNQHNNELDFNINKGVKLQKIDKGCLILQTDKSDGYRVFSIDNNSYDANYWKKSFLDIEEVMNDSYQTKHHLGMLSTFSNTMKDEKNTYVQKDFISQGIKLFNENEIITKDLIEQELLSPFDVVDSYSKFKSQYNKENNLDLEENFNVSTSTLKKEKKKIKSQINLDTKIQIKLDISEGDSLKENIEKGFDEERKMHFYKVFFNEEM